MGRRLTAAVGAALLALIVVGPWGQSVATARPPQAPSIEAHGACDVLDPAKCLYPFPNDYFTVRDRSTATARRVELSPDVMPRNVNGVAIDPTEWNRNDGFSPGSLITTYVPGLDLNKTDGVPINDLKRTFDKNAAVVVIDAKTGKRQLIWTEMDSLASSDSVRNLIVRPAKAEGKLPIALITHGKNLKAEENQALRAEWFAPQAALC